MDLLQVLGYCQYTAEGSHPVSMTLGFGSSFPDFAVFPLHHQCHQSQWKGTISLPFEVNRFLLDTMQDLCTAVQIHAPCALY